MTAGPMASGAGAGGGIPSCTAVTPSKTTRPAPVAKLVHPPSNRTRMMPWAFVRSSRASISVPFSRVPAFSLSISKPARMTERRTHAYRFAIQPLLSHSTSSALQPVPQQPQLRRATRLPHTATARARDTPQAAIERRRNAPPAQPHVRPATELASLAQGSGRTSKRPKP